MRDDRGEELGLRAWFGDRHNRVKETVQPQIDLGASISLRARKTPHKCER